MRRALMREVNRFRRLVHHAACRVRGNPLQDQLGRGMALESQEDGRFPLSGVRVARALHLYQGRDHVPHCGTAR